MFKRILFFVVMLLIGLYYVPILYDAEQEQTVTIVNEEPLLTAKDNIVYPLPANGYENYVGTNIYSYLERHGNPDKVISDKENSREWWSYHLLANQFLQLEVVNNIIQSIFVMGSQVQTGTIHIGMTRENLREETPLSDEFEFNMNSERYHLSLTQNQKQQFPLVQFDNNTFAMIFFHPQLDNVYAIRYLSYRTLVGINYYSLESGEPLPSAYASSTIDSLLPLYSIVTFQNVEKDNFYYEPLLTKIGEKIIETGGKNQLRTQGLSTDLLEQLADTNKEAFYVKGDQVIDPPTRYGIFFNETANHAIFQKTSKRAFAIKTVDDDLLFIFD